MAETDILNPVHGWWDVLGDNPNWSYGWTRKTASNKKLAQPRLGRRYSRELMNTGYSMSLNYIDRPFATVLYLKKFYEQFQNGYFTIIDRDGGHRHHVGNFTTEPNAVETANGKYTIQGLEFQECAQARMLKYPSDWDGSSHFIYSVDDYLTPLFATQGAWSAQLTPAMAGTSLNAPASYEWINPNPAAGDFCQVEYVGWGFQISFRTGAPLGLCDLYVDGVLLGAALDLSNGTAPAGSLWWNPPAPGVDGYVQKIDLPLDKHRVKIVARGARGAASSGTGIIFPAIQVMH